MGTRGYRVYRYKKYYFVTYNNCDSYPSGLGEEMLSEARQDLDGIRKRLEEYLANINAFIGRNGSDELTISKRPPKNDYFIEWMYEIDLDRSVFHINSVPFFSLENLPRSLRRIIGTDNYGNEACVDARYRFKVVTPSAIEESQLEIYRRLLHDGGSAIPFIDLLRSSEHTTQGEEVRLHLLEAFVGQCMCDETVFRAIQVFRLAASGEDLPEPEWLVATTIANLAFIPQIFMSQERWWFFHRRTKRREFSWVRGDTFTHITTHLDDEKNMQAAVSRLVEEAMRQGKNGVVFGVAFSVFHCVVARIDRDAGGSFTHTPAMRFIPSFFAKTPSTPGITALSRLGFRLDPDLFLKASRFNTSLKRASLEAEMKRMLRAPSQPADLSSSIPEDLSCSTPEGHVDPGVELPAELWHKVASSIKYLDDLLQFGRVSKSFQAAASAVLRDPHVDNYRLIKVIKARPALARAIFVATRDGAVEALSIGQSGLKHPENPADTDLLGILPGTTHSFRYMILRGYLEEQSGTGQ
ncbi:hypothetical protein BV22DRAFT_1086091 [Leucogyrophana mollusca]|uniref:Uncharacterized protein n=1 Tax=Leucogyrophana mollusca TaxID=85980 RepID=A0ACB8BP05_9AGAM|nr:hypothetical protein BV22DRAFT_1086091 [Leucogyrophana mollusca]